MSRGTILSVIQNALGGMAGMRHKCRDTREEARMYRDIHLAWYDTFRYLRRLCGVAGTRHKCRGTREVGPGVARLHGETRILTKFRQQNIHDDLTTDTEN